MQCDRPGQSNGQLLAINKDPQTRSAKLNVEFNLPGAKQPLSFCRRSSSSAILRDSNTAWRDDVQTAILSAAWRQRNSRAKLSIAYHSPYSFTVLRGKTGSLTAVCMIESSFARPIY